MSLFFLQNYWHNEEFKSLWDESQIFYNDGNNDLFNGAPNQVRRGYQSSYNQKVYEALDSNGANVTLSSAGFIRFALSGTTRDSNEPFDRIAIPVYNW